MGRYYSAPLLKIYWPFMLSGTTAFFLFSAAHTAMTNDPNDKWNRIVLDVKTSSAEYKVKAQAIEWYNQQQQAKN